MLLGSAAMSSDMEERIRRRAHEIWEQAGRPEGHDEEHWAQAHREITATDTAGQQAGVESNLSTVAAGRMEATESPRAPLSPGAASSGRKSQARRKDAT
jgi:hypothetical protein